MKTSGYIIFLFPLFHVYHLDFNGSYFLRLNYCTFVFWGLIFKLLNPSNTRVPFYLHNLALIPVCISNYINYKVWDEITYPFPNFNGYTVEVWEWISNFIPHFTGHMITYPCLKLIHCNNNVCGASFFLYSDYKGRTNNRPIGLECSAVHLMRYLYFTQAAEEAKKAESKGLPFVRLGSAASNEEGFTVSLGNLCRCICCPRDVSTNQPIRYILLTNWPPSDITIISKV